MFVIDTSVTMTWCFADEMTPETEAVLDLLGGGERAVVPAIWSLEVANVLLVAERRGRLGEAQATRFLELIQQLPIEIEGYPVDLPGVLAAGRRHELSAYDASYLLLAERTGAALATLDRRLGAAAARAGLRLLL